MRDVLSPKTEDAEVGGELQLDVERIAVELVSIAEERFLRQRYPKDELVMGGEGLSKMGGVEKEDLKIVGNRLVTDGPVTFPWTVTVVKNDDVVNAYCAPGGKIVVFTGMINFLVKAQREGTIDDAAAGLACVLAHEISHAVCRHSAERVSYYPFFAAPPLFVVLAASAFGFSDTAADLAVRLTRAVLLYMIDLPHSRKVETEADMVGAELILSSGFPPDVFPQMLGLLSDKANIAEWASTHPASERRAEETRKYIWKRQLTGVEDVPRARQKRAQGILERAKRDFENSVPTERRFTLFSK